MPIVRNKLNQRIQVELASGKTIGLLAGGVAKVADKDLASPHLGNFIERGEIVVLSSTGKKAAAKQKPAEKKRGRKKKKNKS